MNENEIELFQAKFPKSVKEMLRIRAEQEHRSMSSHVIHLIVQDWKLKSPTPQPEYDGAGTA